VQVGKVSVAMPFLRLEPELGLAGAGFVLAAYGLIGALGGLALGLLLPGLGARRCLVGGLAAICVGSLAGTGVPAGWLALARVLEGIGFLAVVVSAPSLLQRAAVGRRRDLVLAAWGAFMPTGNLLALLAAPALDHAHWRWLWVAGGLLAGAYAVLAWRAVPPDADRPRLNARDLPGMTAATLRTPGPPVLAALFCGYAFQYFALVGFLPVLLVDRMGLDARSAGLFTAAAVAMNALGNVSAGLLLRRGVPVWAVIGGAFLTVGTAAWWLWGEALDPVLVAGLAALSLGVSGLVPGSIFAAAPKVAPTAALVPAVLGLVMQGSNLGQLAGPTVTGLVVEAGGWTAAPWMIAAVAAAALVLVAVLRRLLRGGG
jgi:predicted MFS family arabinose efflux permease